MAELGDSRNLEMDGNPAKKMKYSKLSEEDLNNMKNEDLIQRVLQLQDEVEAVKVKPIKDQSLDVLHETVEKLKQQVTESARQESILSMRLAAKDNELQELLTQQRAGKAARNASGAQLQNMMLDPAINLMFIHMKQEMDMYKTKLEQAQAEMAAWKFTPDSQTGKKLMGKCRMLLQENEELGKTVSTGRIAKLESDIALKEKLIDEMKKSEKETEEFLSEMDEDMESMQSTVYLLKQELKEARERLRLYEQSADPSGTEASSGGAIKQPLCNGSDPVNDTKSAVRIKTEVNYSDVRTLRDGRTCGDESSDSDESNISRTIEGNNCKVKSTAANTRGRDAEEDLYTERTIENSRKSSAEPRTTLNTQTARNCSLDNFTNGFTTAKLSRTSNDKD